MTVYIGSIANQRMHQNGCHFKSASQNHYIFDAHMWGTYVHMYTKNEVSMSNPVPGGGVHGWQCQCQQWQHQCQWRRTIHDCIRLLVDKPNEPKITHLGNTQWEERFTVYTSDVMSLVYFPFLVVSLQPNNMGKGEQITDDKKCGLDDGDEVQSHKSKMHVTWK